MAKKEMEKKGPQALSDEDLEKSAGGGIYPPPKDYNGLIDGAWSGIYLPGDPKWNDLNLNRKN